MTNDWPELLEDPAVIVARAQARLARDPETIRQLQEVKLELELNRIARDHFCEEWARTYLGPEGQLMIPPGMLEVVDAMIVAGRSDREIRRYIADTDWYADQVRNAPEKPQEPS